MNFKKIVFLHFSLGHYHIARMRALSKECQKADISLFSLELAGTEKTYTWSVDTKEAGFNNICLFPQETLEAIPRKKLWAALKSKLEEIKPDVVFLVGYSDYVMRQALFWCNRHQVATVLLSDSTEFDKQRFWPLEVVKSFFVSRCDAAFVGGITSARYVRKLGMPDERIVPGCDVIDNALFQDRAVKNKPVRLEIRSQRNLPRNYFLCVSRLIQVKNLIRLLDAYKLYRSQTDELSAWNLVICGRGPEEENIKNYLAAFPDPVREGVLLAGHVKQPDIIDFFSCASSLILPSTSEPWGLVVNEAMTSGIPVIVSNKVGCSLDLVKEGKNGWLFDPFDVNDIAEGMIRMSRTEETDREAMGDCGREIISAWGLDKFCRGTFQSAEIAVKHKNQR